MIVSMNKCTLEVLTWVLLPLRLQDRSCFDARRKNRVRENRKRGDASQGEIWKRTRIKKVTFQS